MRTWSRFLWKLRYGWRRGALDHELQEEMRFHLDQLEQVHRNPAAARREFGNVGLLMEDSRSAWGWLWAENFVQDLRFAGRAFKRDWTSSVAAITALALGTGLAIAIFTLVNAVLLRPLPYKDPDRLVMLWGVNKQLGWDQDKISAPEMLDWKHSGLFESIVGFTPNMTSITGPGEPELTHGYQVTAGFLQLLGTQPMLGRALTPEEEKKGGDYKVMLLRHSFWMRRFGGDPNVIGQKILVERALPDRRRDAARIPVLQPADRSIPALAQHARRHPRPFSLLSSGRTAQDRDHARAGAGTRRRTLGAVRPRLSPNQSRLGRESGAHPARYHRPRAAGALGAACGGGHGAFDRLRERCQSAPGTRHRPLSGTGAADGARRRAQPGHAATAYREPDACRSRKSRRIRNGACRSALLRWHVAPSV